MIKNTGKPKLKSKVEKALEKVKPSIEAHGGGFEVVSAVKGKVKIRIMGACLGCPMARLTFGAEMEEMIKEKVAGVKKVEFID